jgi:hypothetical protein
MAATTRRLARARPLPRLAVRVTHGDLAYARFPVMVGHYERDAIVSAEARLDAALAGRLTRQHLSGAYPGAQGTTRVFLAPGEHPPGAIVIGLGEVGALTAATLAHAVEQGTKAWLARRRDGSRGLSLLLIGTGSGGVTVGDAVTGLLRGVLRAVTASAGRAGSSGPPLAAIDLLELYEDRAIQAARALEWAAHDPDLASHLRVISRVVRIGGARRRASYREDDRWWRRLQVMEGPQGALVFNALTERARAEVHLRPTARARVDAFLDRALRQSADDPAVAMTLNELLVPAELREQARDRRDLVLVLDEDTARYPWELLRERPPKATQAAARHRQALPAPQVTESGLIRQLSTRAFRKRVASTSALKALVVGDPPSDFPPLDGAVREAEAVAGRLRAHGYEVTTRIRVRADDVISALFGSEYRIMHLAGHGVYRHVPDTWPEVCPDCGQAGTCTHREPVTGMVIGPGVYLTPSDIAWLQCVPQVVFLNCCHLGLIERAPSTQGRVQRRRPAGHAWVPALWASRSTVAANLAAEFIRLGARIVVASGWAVEDTAAATFAASFYEQMLERRLTFGRAVTEARRRTYHRAPRTNAWGAYQCYGDPHFALVPAEDDGSRQVMRPMTPGELVIELESLTAQALEPDSDRERVRQHLGRLLLDVPDEWLGLGNVREALGSACLMLDDPAGALTHFSAAMGLDGEAASIAAIGRFSVVQTERAAALAQEGWPLREARATLEAGRRRLEWLLSLGETPLRLTWCATAARHASALAGTPVERARCLRVARRYERRAARLQKETPR